MLNKLFYSLILITIVILLKTCMSVPETKIASKAKEAMAFLKHPGTIKMITMLDNSVKIKPISDIPERHQFIYYDSNDSKVDKENAVRGTPIVEVRMHSLIGDKLVPTKEANLLYTEMFDSKGNLIDTHTMWRDGIPGGKRKTQ